MLRAAGLDKGRLEVLYEFTTPLASVVVSRRYARQPIGPARRRAVCMRRTRSAKSAIDLLRRAGILHTDLHLGNYCVDPRRP